MTLSLRVAPIAACVATFFVTFTSAAEVPGEYFMPVARSNLAGSLLALHHLSAQLANDELMRRGVLKKDPRVRGWITDFETKSEGVLVTFVGDEGGVPHALYRVRVPRGRKDFIYEALSPAQPLAKSASARFAARTLAIAEFAKRDERCAERYDAVVLPIGSSRDPYIFVYMLAATDKPDVAFAGDDVRYEISADGVHIDDQRTFTEGCLTLSVPKRKDREKAVPIKLTLGADPTPTEWHTFLSHRYYQALDVETPESRLVWTVRKGQIEFVGPMKD